MNLCVASIFDPSLKSRKPKTDTQTHRRIPSTDDVWTSLIWYDFNINWSVLWYFNLFLWLTYTHRDRWLEMFMFDHDDGCLTDIFFLRSVVRVYCWTCQMLYTHRQRERDEKIEEVIKTFSKKYVFNILRSFTVSFVCLCVQCRSYKLLKRHIKREKKKRQFVTEVKYLLIASIHKVSKRNKSINVNFVHVQYKRWSFKDDVQVWNGEWNEEDKKHKCLTLHVSYTQICFFTHFFLFFNNIYNKKHN